VGTRSETHAAKELREDEIMLVKWTSGQTTYKALRRWQYASVSDDGQVGDRKNTTLSSSCRVQNGLKNCIITIHVIKDTFVLNIHI
jgi:hypothetical protein